MILGWSSFKVVQMVPVRCISRSQELKIDFLTKNLKNLLVRNHWTDFNIILQKCSFGDPLPRLFKPFGFVKKHDRQGAGLIFPIYLYRKLEKNLVVRNHRTDFNITSRKCFLGDPLPRCSSRYDLSKNMAARGRGLFSLYIYIENFNDLLFRNHWTDFSITGNRNVSYQDCSSFIKIVQAIMIRKKNMAARGRGLFSLYIYIENFKTLLVRNHWTDFIVTWQKCFLGDPLPRLFK